MFPLLEAFQKNQGVAWALAHEQVLAYAFGLLAVGCLALRRRRRGAVISGFLTLLWLWMGVGFLRDAPAWDKPGTWLGILVLLQSGLFLWFGVIRPRLSFEPRASVRPIAGTLLLIYALGVYPLSGAALALPLSPLALPFPGLVFTLGLMLFLLRPVPLQILLLPFLWAAAGGDRIFEELRWADLVHLAALACALLLLVPRPAEWRDGDENYRIEMSYERVYRHRQRCGRLLWGLALSVCLFSFLGTTEISDAIFTRLAVSSSVALVLVTVIWLMSPAWFNLSFRYLAWWAVLGLHRVNAAGKWLLSGWKRLLAAMAVVGFALWFLDNEKRVLKFFRDADNVSLLIGGILVLVLLRAVYRARRCIVIMPFMDSCRMGEEAERNGKALASRLRNELANIAELYRTIDEALPEQKGKIVESSVVVEDVVESVLDAIGPNSNVKLRGVEIPVGLVIRAMGRLVRGPRLTGSFQKDGDRFLLVAELSGGRWDPGSWRITSDDLDLGEEKDETLIAQRLVEQLACRIIAKIGNVGSPRWEAVHHFTQGLRAYRGTQLADKDVGPDLRRAEREFIQALREDGSFTQCHYDLGVVYQKLDEDVSAEASFRRCLAEDPARSEAYYSLANVYFDSGDFSRASIYAGKALETQPGQARTWNLRGVAQDRQHRKKAQEEVSGGARTPPPEEVRIDLEIAVAVAWRDLCRAALKKPAFCPRKQMSLAGLCLANLAIIRMKDETPESLEASRRLIGQALHLFPQEPWYYLILGENLVLQSKVGDQLALQGKENDKALENARTELYRAFGDNLAPEDEADRWAYMLAAASRLSVDSENRDNAQREVTRAFRHFLDAAVPPEDLILATGERARQRISVGSYGESLAACDRILVEVVDLVKGEGAIKVAALRHCIHCLRRLYVDPKEPAPGGPASEEERQWRKAQGCIHRARTALDGNPGRAREELSEAIKILEELNSKKQWPTRQVARQGLHALRAKACLLEGKAASSGDLLRRALADAQQAVAERPESAARRWILGDVYCALRDFDQAETERTMALKLGSGLEMLDGPDAICDLARSHIHYALVPDPKLQVDRYSRAREFFVTLQSRIESKPLAQDQEVQDLQLEVHACVHFWLGRFHELLNENSKAIYHLEIALAMGYAADEAVSRLRKIYSGSGLAEEAQRVLTRGVQPEAVSPPGSGGLIRTSRRADLTPTGSPQPPQSAWRAGGPPVNNGGSPEGRTP